MTTNELALAKAFREAGFEQAKAEALAQTIFDAIRDNVATKSDAATTRAELKADIAATRAELKADIAAVNARIDLVEHRLLTRLGGLMVVAIGALFAALHAWPPH